jgi:hypothetical protein
MCGLTIMKLPIVGGGRLWDADRWGMMGEGGDVVQKCTTLVPKNAGMTPCGANLHHIRRNLMRSVQM